jgi:two-component system response regulator NreC
LKVKIYSEEGLRLAALSSLIRERFDVVELDKDADVIVWDLSLSDLHDKRILVIGDDIVLFEALRLGHIGGVITPQVSSEEFMVALQAIERGETFLHSSLLTKFLEPPKLINYFNIPTPRETDVLRYIAQGYTNCQTAEALSISVRTVESHRANLMDKLHLHSRVELVRYARENGVIE